jgi:hypothetical protein
MPEVSFSCYVLLTRRNQVRYVADSMHEAEPHMRPGDSLYFQTVDDQPLGDFVLKRGVKPAKRKESK